MKNFICSAFILILFYILIFEINRSKSIITKQQQIIDSLKIENTNWKELYKLSE